MTHCSSCDISIAAHVHYCPRCGGSINNKTVSKIHHHVNLVITFYIVTLLFWMGVYFTTRRGISLIQEIIIECMSILIILGFVSVDYKNILQLYRFPKVNILIYLGVFLIPLCTAFIVYYGMEAINLVLFNHTGDHFYSGYAEYENPLFWSVLFVAIIPAIFEEVAFRGFLFNQLQKVKTVNVTIILTAFIFSLVHFSILSWIWIFPFGLLLGFLRYKYNTLWLGMIIHFLHNLIILSLDYYYFSHTLIW